MLDDFYTANPVFPAHAGMSPQIVSSGRQVTSFPRSRGDEPSSANSPKAALTFSPLTRG